MWVNVRSKLIKALLKTGYIPRHHGIATDSVTEFITAIYSKELKLY